MNLAPLFDFDHGIRIFGTELWLDATRRKDLSFVSHAHYDHAVPHGRVVCSSRTEALYRRRILKNRRSSQTSVLTHEFGEPFALGDLRVTLFPSGHILGASQILIESDRRVVYTGDFKLDQGATSEKIEIVPCDVLVMECTYGRPQYRFPDRVESVERLVSFVESAFEERVVPVIYAYSLGKSQEVIKILGDEGFNLLVDEQTYENARIYEKLGVSLRRYELLGGGLSGQKVLVVPPGRQGSQLTRQIRRKRTAMLTGWGVNDHARARFRVDEVIPLSDHCDFARLLEYVERAKPTRVYTFHGPKEFAGVLRKRGYRAVHLPLSHQLDLWEDL